MFSILFQPYFLGFLQLPSWKLTDNPALLEGGIFEDDSPFVKVGYVSFPEGTTLLEFVSCIVVVRLSHAKDYLFTLTRRPTAGEKGTSVYFKVIDLMPTNPRKSPYVSVG